MLRHHPRHAALSTRSALTRARQVDQLRIGVTYQPDGCETARKTRKGDKLSMHYTGTLKSDGSKFDSSRDRNEPFTFTLGVGAWRVLLEEVKLTNRHGCRPSDQGLG